MLYFHRCFPKRDKKFKFLRSIIELVSCCGLKVTPYQEQTPPIYEVIDIIWLYLNCVQSEKASFKMEQEQSDFLSGRKVNGTLAACLGAVFGIGLTAIIAYVYFDAPKSMEIHLALFVFVAGESDGFLI